ncbi:MAG TPA: hypothetical protein PLL10_05570 [Elusimicrobiales bacterium]|nr:hypothetical protein [Elusimicrobiales bacterium]
MRKLILAMAMLAITSFAFAGSAVNQLGSAVGVTAADTIVEAPSASVPEIPVYADDEAEAKGRCSDHNNNLPGCPGFCKKHQEHGSCALPFHCRNNMTLHACRMHCVSYPNAQGCKKDKSADSEATLFDEGLAKANCVSNPNAPGCPLFCKDHHSYPGCPMFCQLNPLNPACRGNKAVETEAETAVTPEDEAEAKGRCSDHHNNLPGCPGYCSKPQHQSKPACALPFHCRNNMTLHACRMHCVKYPKAPGCGGNKSAEAEVSFDEDLAKANCVTNPNAPGCPGYCNDHHSYPGCPMFCQLNPLHPACGHVPAYCSTNPNGYNCPKAAAEEEKGIEEAANEDGEKGWLDDHYCRKHKMRPGCPMFCQMQPLHKSCNHKPAYCHTNPNGYGCMKSVETEEAVVIDGTDEEKSLQINQCHKHHNNWPGCPGYCNAHPMHSSCRPPAYCHTNPNGYGCKK